MAETDRRRHDALEEWFHALVGLRPPAGLTAYRLALISLRAPLHPGGMTNGGERG